MPPTKKRLYKIAFISTHGTGKTTLCYEVAAELKKHGLKVKVFSEIAAAAYEQGIPINETTTLPAQLYIMMQHITEELRAIIRNYQVVICDRSVFDNLVYLERRCGENRFIRDFLQGYAEKFPYDMIYKLPLVGELIDDGIREVYNKEFQVDIYDRLNKLLEELNIPHKTLPMPSTEMRKEWAGIIVQETLEAIRQARAADKTAAQAHAAAEAAPAEPVGQNK
ncbi:MAG: ATP-binding protein [Elusimicrobia bacterium]|nr:ATP-binding protein [Elusimicrobiota bacterium]